MIIKIYKDFSVVLLNMTSQILGDKIKVEIEDKLLDTLYSISINGNEYQEIKGNFITLPEFTNFEKDVIINVRITQMGNIIKEFKSDKYPLKLVPVIGNIIEDAFPIGCNQLINRQSHFENSVLEIIEEFRGRLEELENEGEII